MILEKKNWKAPVVKSLRVSETLNGTTVISNEAFLANVNNLPLSVFNAS